MKSIITIEICIAIEICTGIANFIYRYICEQ